MNALELRLGNYIFNKAGEIEKVYTLNDNCINGYEGNAGILPEDEKDFMPIPLTKEWFLNCGAVKDENGDDYIPNPIGNDIRFYLVSGHIQETKSFYCPLSNFRHIDMVHLFQNLFYSLTGQELLVNTPLESHIQQPTVP